MIQLHVKIDCIHVITLSVTGRDFLGGGGVKLAMQHGPADWGQNPNFDNHIQTEIQIVYLYSRNSTKILT
jgi:hypothetical protein